VVVAVSVAVFGAVAEVILDASDETEEAMDDTMEDAEAAGLLNKLALVRS